MAVARTLDLVLLLALGVVWGHSYIFIAVGLEHFSPLLFASLRFDAAAVALVLVALARTGRFVAPRGAAQWAAVATAASLNVAGYHAFLFWGQQHTTPGIAAVIIGLNPILATVASRFLLPSERVDARDWSGLGLGFLGIALLSALRHGSVFDLEGVGEAAIFLAIVFWALGSVVVKRVGGGLDLAWFVAWQTLVGALVLHAAAAAAETPAWDATPAALASLGYLAFVASAGGLVVYFRLLRNLGAVRANLVSYLSAIVAGVAAWAFLDLPVEPRSVVAFVLIAAGFALVARAPAANGRSRTGLADEA